MNKCDSQIVQVLNDPFSTEDRNILNYIAGLRKG